MNHIGRQILVHEIHPVYDRDSCSVVICKHREVVSEIIFKMFLSLTDFLIGASFW